MNVSMHEFLNGGCEQLVIILGCRDWKRLRTSEVDQDCLNEKLKENLTSSLKIINDSVYIVSL